MKFLSMGKIVMRSLFGKPSTYGYPFTPREYPDSLRGKVIIDIDDCIFCGMCSRKCPTDAITVDREAKTWEISRMQCIYCCVCIDTCPKKCLDSEHTHVSPDTIKQVDVVCQQAERETPEQGESEALMAENKPEAGAADA